MCFSLWKTGKTNLDDPFYSFLGFINHQTASNTSCRVWLLLLCSCFYYKYFRDVLLTEHVCVKSAVLFCLLKPNFSLLSIVTKLITSLLLSSFLFQQGRIKAADAGNASATAVFIKIPPRTWICCSVMYVSSPGDQMKALEETPHIYTQEVPTRDCAIFCRWGNFLAVLSLIQ